MIARMLFDPSHIIDKKQFEDKADALLKDRSREETRRRHIRNRAGVGVSNIKGYTDAIPWQEECDTWRKGKDQNDIKVKKIVEKWNMNWTPEYADLVFQEFQRLENLLSVYAECVPEGEKVLDHLANRAKRLNLGEGDSILQFGAGELVGMLLAGVVAAPILAVLGFLASDMVGKAVRNIDINKNINSMEDFRKTQKTTE